MRGTRWQGADELEVDHDGVVGDREWSAVDEHLRCVRAIDCPAMMTIVVDPSTLPAVSDDDSMVTYWNRYIPASVHEAPLADEMSELIGVRVRLAHAQRPAFVWDAEVSVLFTSELRGLPDAAERYRANVVIDDHVGPVEIVPGLRLRLGSVELRVDAPIDRCVVIEHHPDTGVRDERLLHRLRPGALLGWGCRVVRPGHVRVGDDVAVAAAV